MLQQKFSVFPLNLVKPIILTTSVRRIPWAFTGGHHTNRCDKALAGKLKLDR